MSLCSYILYLVPSRLIDYEYVSTAGSLCTSVTAGVRCSYVTANRPQVRIRSVVVFTSDFIMFARVHLIDS